jgi:hypothetical protein
MVKNMDWDKVGEAIGDMDITSVDGILNLRYQIKDVTKLINANMNLINNVQDTLTKKTVAFGGKRYTFGGLFGFGVWEAQATWRNGTPKTFSARNSYSLIMRSASVLYF